MPPPPKNPPPSAADPTPDQAAAATPPPAPAARSYNAAEVQQMRDDAYQTGAAAGQAEAIENLSRELAPITAALGLPDSASPADIVAAIAKTRAAAQGDPLLEALIAQKVKAGIPRDSAERIARKQIAHNALLKAHPKPVNKKRAPVPAK